MNAENSVKHLRLSELEMGSMASIVELLLTQKTKQAHQKTVTRVKNFICAIMVLRSLPLVPFNLISVSKTISAEYPSDLIYTITYMEK